MMNMYVNKTYLIFVQVVVAWIAKVVVVDVKVASFSAQRKIGRRTSVGPTSALCWRGRVAPGRPSGAPASAPCAPGRPPSRGGSRVLGGLAPSTAAAVGAAPTTTPLCSTT